MKVWKSSSARRYFVNYLKLCYYGGGRGGGGGVSGAVGKFVRSRPGHSARDKKGGSVIGIFRIYTLYNNNFCIAMLFFNI